MIENIIEQSVREEDKRLLVRLLHEQQNIMRRIEEVGRRVYPDIKPAHNWKADTYSLIDAI